MENMELDTDQIAHLAKRAREQRAKADELCKQIRQHDRAAERAEHDLLVALGLRDYQPTSGSPQPAIIGCLGGQLSQKQTFEAGTYAKADNGTDRRIAHLGPFTEEQDNGGT